MLLYYSYPFRPVRFHTLLPFCVFASRSFTALHLWLRFSPLRSPNLTPRVPLRAPVLRHRSLTTDITTRSPGCFCASQVYLSLCAWRFQLSRVHRPADALLLLFPVPNPPHAVIPHHPFLQPPTSHFLRYLFAVLHYILLCPGFSALSCVFTRFALPAAFVFALYALPFHPPPFCDIGVSRLLALRHSTHMVFLFSPRPLNRGNAPPTTINIKI